MIALICIIAYIVGKLILLPIELLIIVLKYTNIVAFDTTKMNYFLKELVRLIPFIIITIMKYINSEFFDKIFFTAMSLQHQSMSIEYEKIPYPWFRESFSRYIKYILVYTAFLFLYTVIPIIIPILLPFVSVFRFGYKIKQVNWFFLFFMLFGYMLPFTRSFTRLMAQWWFESRILIREFLDPVLGRKLARFTTIFTNHEPFLLGMAFPYIFINRIENLETEFSGLVWMIHLLAPLILIFGFSSGGMIAPMLINSNLTE